MVNKLTAGIKKWAIAKTKLVTEEIEIEEKAKTKAERA